MQSIDRSGAGKYALAHVLPLLVANGLWQGGLWTFAPLRYLYGLLPLLITIGVLYGGKAALCFVLAALIGILLLETINYIEHYGLCRRQLEGGRYERVGPLHSWNSNHRIGRLSLFELPRHADHHFRASRKYPVLRHHERSPQMPTGYPGMMLLATIPALWFRAMDRRLQRYTQAA